MHPFHYEHVIVVGTGGTGSFLLPPLMRYLNSKKSTAEIVFVDGDKYDQGNVNRQEFAHSRIGVNKARAQLDVYAQKFPQLEIVAISEYLGDRNVAKIIPEHSVVFCCVDNHVARSVISRHCQRLDNVLLISGGNEETDGNVQAFCRVDGKSLNEPIEKLHPEILTRNDGDRSEMSCEQLAALPGGGQVIFANLFSATLMCAMFFTYDNPRPVITQDGVKDVPCISEVMFDINQVKTVRIIDGKSEC